MLDLLVGSRIAQACRDAWNLDGFVGQLSAVLVVLCVSTSVGVGFAKIIQSLI